MLLNIRIFKPATNTLTIQYIKRKYWEYEQVCSESGLSFSHEISLFELRLVLI